MKTQKKILACAYKLTLFRPRDLPRLPGLHEQLRRMVDRGLLVRVSRGLYTLSDVELSEHATMAQVCLRVPEGVVCLLSALAFHKFTTQLPHKVWLAVGRNAALPKVKDLPVRIIRVSEKSFAFGVQRVHVNGVTVRVYNPARTIADCFKFRSAVGIDVAVEALREGLRKGLCSRKEIDRAASVCRVSRVMRPYMEALV